MRGVLKPQGSVIGPSSKLIMGLALLTLGAACSRSNDSSVTKQQLHDSAVTPEADTNRAFETDEGELRVVSRQVFAELVRQGRARPGVRPDEQSPDQLLV